MTPLALTLQPIAHGWSVSLSNGHKLARFCGLGARWRAEHYLTHLATTEGTTHAH